MTNKNLCFNFRKELLSEPFKDWTKPSVMSKMLLESLAIQCCTRKWTKPRQSSNVISYLLHRYTRRNKIFKLEIFGLNSTFKVRLCFHLANSESPTALHTQPTSTTVPTAEMLSGKNALAWVSIRVLKL